MKETVYRCNRCHRMINGTVHRIGVTGEKGEQTRYGALFENIDLCDNCIEEVTLAVIAEIDHVPGQQDIEKSGQQDEKEETPEILNAEPITYQCSKVIKTCGYAEKVGGALTCNYIGIEGHRRGCDPETCNKYKGTERKRGRKPKTAKGQTDMPEVSR